MRMTRSGSHRLRTARGTASRLLAGGARRKPVGQRKLPVTSAGRKTRY